MIVLIVGLYMVVSVRAWRSLIHIVSMILPVVVLNLNWIIAPYLGTKNIDTIAGFTGENFAAFATQAIEPLDIYTTNILLYGFW